MHGKSVMAATVAAMLAQAASATVLNLGPTKDNTLFSESGSLSDGAGARFYVGLTSGGNARRGVMAFNLSSVPAGAVITDVKLTLNFEFGHQSQVVQLHKLLADWGEGTSSSSGGGAPATTGDATWTYRFFNTSTWTSAGGDFTAAASASKTIGDAGTGFYTIGSTAPVVADAQQWVDSPATNFGWLLLGDEANFQSAMRFSSRQSSISANRPVLTIDYSVPSVWNVNAGGNWSTSTNWSGGVPNSAGAVAKFGSAINAPQTVTVDAAKTVGTILFDNANAYTLAGTNSITLTRASGHAAINVKSGSHLISAPLTISQTMDLSVSSGGALNLSGDMTVASGLALSKFGDGQLTVKNVRADVLNVQAGTAAVAPNGSNAALSYLKTLSIATVAAFDLSDNKLVVDYTGSGPGDNSPSATIRTYLINGRGGVGVDPAPTWAGSGGITSSVAANADPTGLAVGYREAQPPDFDIDPLASFGGQTVDDTAMLIRYTYCGDANLDGKVDRDDLLILQNSFNQTSGVDWLHGDFDYNGTCDRDDLLALQGNYGNDPIPSSSSLTAQFGSDFAASFAGAAVPEPGSLVLTGLGSLALQAAPPAPGLPSLITPGRSPAAAARAILQLTALPAR